MEATDRNLGPSAYHQQVFTMSAPAEYYKDMHSIAITRETIDQLALKTYNYQLNGHPCFQSQPIVSYNPAPKDPVALEVIRPSTSSYSPNTSTVTSPAKVEVKDSIHPPPKKKWINQYLIGKLVWMHLKFWSLIFVKFNWSNCRDWVRSTCIVRPCSTLDGLALFFHNKLQEHVECVKIFVSLLSYLPILPSKDCP